MEALNFLKFWRPTALTTTIPTGISSPIIEIEEEEEDSFFDLELSVSDFNGGKQSNRETHLSNDVFSKRKIIPIEPSPSISSPKPQSPISVLKSAPKFRVFKKTQKTEEVKNRDAPKKKQSSGEESAICDASTSKRFAKDAFQKYLKLIVKSSKKKGEKSKLCSASSISSPMSSPATQSRARVGNKSFGKSKSASATVGIESPLRRDDSLLQQHDGIQSAILHCKRSFNSSRESSMLSRSSSDSIKSISSDCSVLSRYSSDKWIDSARSSSEEGSVSL